MNNRDTVFFFDIFAGFHEVFCVSCDFIINIFAGFFCGTVRAVEQGDTHGNGSDIEMFLADHIDCFENIFSIYHDKAKSFRRKFRYGAWN